MTHNWNAPSYDHVATGVQSLGHALLDRLELAGNEVVLDAGCGSGVVTEALVERVPDGHVIGVDASPAMIERAGALLGDRAELHVADLTRLALEQPVDVVFSSATFHWVQDHDVLFRRLHAALRPGGRLLAQFGGKGNVHDVSAALSAVGAQEPFAPHLRGWRGPWTFNSPDLEREILEAAGFTDVEAGLHDVRVTTDEPQEYLETVMCGEHLDRLPADLREPFARRVTERLPGPPLHIDYVRLTVSARRPPE